MSEVEANISLSEQEGLLSAGGNLNWRTEEEFQAACRRLLESDREKLVVDFGEVRGISSANLSFLVNLHHWAIERGKQLVLRVSSEMARLFDRTRLEDLVGMKIVKAGPGEGRPSAPEGPMRSATEE